MHLIFHINKHTIIWYNLNFPKNQKLWHIIAYQTYAHAAPAYAHAAPIAYAHAPG